MPAAPNRRSGIISPLLPAFILTAACAVDGEDSPSPGTPPAAAATLPVLENARAWTGDLPCADCAALRTTLVLDPDGSFRAQRAYLGKAPESDTLFQEVGYWTVDRGRGRVTLHGNGGTGRHFSPRADGSLLALDPEGNEADPAHDHTLTLRPDTPPVQGVVQTLGAFSYFADAALLVECNGGLQLPVAMTEEYLPLERTYTAGEREPGSPMVVRIRGRVEERPAMEGDGRESAFVVDSFDGAGGEGCAALQLREALADGEWLLVALGGEAVASPPGRGQVPSLSWDARAMQAAGSGGCNRFMGPAALRGALLVIGPTASTLMFCEGAMELEERYLSTLAVGGVLRLEGSDLVLYQGGAEAARFRKG